MKLYENIPAELKSAGYFCVWRYEYRPGKEKPDKVPYHPMTGKRVKVNRVVTKLTRLLFKIDDTTNQIEPQTKSFQAISVTFGNDFEVLHSPNHMLDFHPLATNFLVVSLARSLFLVAQLLNISLVTYW